MLSARTAPEGWERFRVIGPDLFVAWDVEDPASDVVPRSRARRRARALHARAPRRRTATIDFDDFERAIRAVEKQIDGLEEILTSAGTIEGGVAKIKQARGDPAGQSARAVATLDECCDAARRELGQRRAAELGHQHRHDARLHA